MRVLLIESVIDYKKILVRKKMYAYCVLNIVNDIDKQSNLKYFYGTLYLIYS